MLESQAGAEDRAAQISAHLVDYGTCSRRDDSILTECYHAILSKWKDNAYRLGIMASGDGAASIRQAEDEVMSQLQFKPKMMVRPKAHLGNLFAAAAPVQVALAAALVEGNEEVDGVLATCFGFGSEQAAFLVDNS